MRPYPNRRSAGIKRDLGRIVFFLAAAVSACFGQDDCAGILVSQRVLQDSSSASISSHNGIDSSVKVDVDLVLVPVTVTDRMGRVVTGLQKSNFNIYDQRNPEVIRNFSTEDAPISLGIIFDASSSMHEKIDRSREAVIQLLRRSNPQDEFFLIGFNDSPRLLVDFTNSIEEVQEAIAKTQADGRTALLDALYLGLEQLKKARYERKALIIVSDGGDNHSRYTTREVWSVLTEADVQIYAMGLFDEAPRTKAERRGADLLASTTSVTGGLMIPIHNLRRSEMRSKRCRSRSVTNT